MHSKIAMSPFASMLPHLCENDNNFEIKLRIVTEQVTEQECSRRQETVTVWSQNSDVNK